MIPRANSWLTRSERDEARVQQQQQQQQQHQVCSEERAREDEGRKTIGWKAKVGVTSVESLENSSNEKLANHAFWADDELYGRELTRRSNERVKRTPKKTTTSPNSTATDTRQNRPTVIVRTPEPINPTNRLMQDRRSVIVRNPMATNVINVLREYDNLVNNLMRQNHISREEAIRRAELAHPVSPNPLNNIRNH
ncbi:uncharacterized protein [Venturia canescens]|uniref:uncharacterized protein n=1 Tax=Venturia canescens TaxID=32260 RepID=UPI001C9D3ACD|nr:uncharacterized protein LOC122416577 [Venturia canescens]